MPYSIHPIITNSIEGLASESITKNDYFQNGMTQMFFPPGLAKNVDSGMALIQIPNVHVSNPVHKKILLSLLIRDFYNYWL